MTLKEDQINHNEYHFLLRFETVNFTCLLFFYPDDGNNTFLLNTDKHLSHYTYHTTDITEQKIFTVIAVKASNLTKIHSYYVVYLPEIESRPVTRKKKLYLRT
jgi:hypothetical protein